MPRPAALNRLSTSSQNNAFGDPSRRETPEVISSLPGARLDCKRWENQNSELYWSTSEMDFEIRVARSGTSLFFRYEFSSSQMLNLRL